MSFEDLAESVAIQKLIRQRCKAKDEVVEAVVQRETKQIEPEFEALAVVALVVGELHQHDDLRERIEVHVALRLVFALHDLCEYLLKAACKQIDNSNLTIIRAVYPEHNQLELSQW